MAKKVWTKKSTVPRRVKAARMRNCYRLFTAPAQMKKGWWYRFLWY